jgi:hypothetical protein
VALPTREEGLICAMFEASTTIEVGDGRKAILWSDRCLGNRSIQYVAHNLCNAVPARTRARCLVCDALRDGQWIRDIMGALDIAALEQYVNLWECLQSIQLSAMAPDRFIWKWSPNQCYSSSSTYQAFFKGQCGVPGTNILCKVKAPPSRKFFVWLALLDGCWTWERLLRHHMIDDGQCALSSQAIESIDHLLLGCCFSREVWVRLLPASKLHQLCPMPDDLLVDWWTSKRKQLPRDF